MILERRYVDIQSGDLVLLNNEVGNNIECLVIHDNSSQHEWMLVDIHTCEVISSYTSLEMLRDEITLISKADKLKLLIEP